MQKYVKKSCSQCGVIAPQPEMHAVHEPKKSGKGTKVVWYCTDCDLKRRKSQRIKYGLYTLLAIVILVWLMNGN